MKTRNIYIVGGNSGYINWMQGEECRDMRRADLVVFTGGEDVSPQLYGKKHHSTSYHNLMRDASEMDEFKIARDLNIPILGICRGAQFLCVMAGGILVQHQSHPARHAINAINIDSKWAESVVEITVTSTHHQRQYPWLLPANQFKLLGWSNLSPFSFGEDNEDLSFDKDGKVLPEVENCYYKKINALAIQSHPEFAFPEVEKWESNYIDHCRMLLDKLMNRGL